jgi:hypothetical protein
MKSVSDKMKIVISICIGIIVVFSAFTIYLASPIRAAGNPLVIVTRDYVDSKVNTINFSIQSVENGVSDLKTQMSIVSEYIVENTPAPAEGKITTLKYTPILLASGKTLIGYDGTEIILRSGAANAVVPATASGNLANMTTGSELADGASVPRNNMVLVSRTDGRGVIAVGGDVWVMVKGVYSIS